MYCQNCGFELADDAKSCSNCGASVKRKRKNVYIALILTFVVSGLGSIYAGNVKKGAILLAARILTMVLSWVLSIFFLFTVFIWAFSFYEAYRDVEIANGNANPRLFRDFVKWGNGRRIAAAIIICFISFITVAGIMGMFISTTDYSPYSDTHYYTSGSSGGSVSHSSHYGGVDTSPHTVARQSPDWYYDYYDYGDYDDIDEYLESQGYD